MAAFPDTSNSNGEQASEPVPKAETSGPGGGNEAKTSAGAGDNRGTGGGSDGGAAGDSGAGEIWNNWQDAQPTGIDPNRKVLYSHLKDMAIDALELSGARDQKAIASSIGTVLSSFDMQAETADVLASMVVAAYSCAQQVHDERAVFLAYSCFSDAQLTRIVKLARGT